ncbi:antitoxin Xre/MbcA/ParS toxin-binding domain-containing protein [Pseudomonas chlororaphis]|uniref:antitoxin Xre/MbcA/ParS toxin-binding domain-containing protein n=1 Tax=Pseudomonas chlororaphis TaxID=587753 RepID=UPI001F14C762|nr:antitoxin Xre/MbcA/ParS toxin-binding domain-containing protein [Pseudomonas chlororaphis]
MLGTCRLAESWLIRPAPGLGGQVPCSLISTQSGWTLVEKSSDANRIWRVHLTSTNPMDLGFRTS